ncbi:hypothetical protein CYLTODRAFT_354146 [Cylindrobasidium torrendii FP15055 ss-10]|uniref:AIG1-type G domain-containing protein n=1 Tax=Cylindrobasidium torrendii FP15055 ss-10 TaxID=1314674 RepID=A0A0D7B8M1_9AGAR|nr:hypothetical protein CYLTODRAFT_354146 [Cylindrobasidium torrendii FP15055 ss-10]
MKQGIIKSAKNRAEFTILLVGETGVGKTCFLSFFANVIEGRSPAEYVPVHDINNEQGGSQKCSQTQAARVYEFRSRNDVRIRILDTPGLADTRGISKDQEHKKNIAETIQNYIPVVNAVIVLANGTQPRLGVATDYALTTLSSIFPRSLRDNIAFLFTNVSNALSWNFQPDSIPSFLQSAQQLIVDNPFAMREKYLSIIAQTKQHNASVLGRLERSITSAHDDAVEELVKLFDWMDGLEPQPTSEILNLYNKLQGIETRIENALASMAQATIKKKELEKIKASMDKSGVDMKTYKEYEKVIRSPTWIQDERDYHNTLCSVPKCYSNCHQHCGLSFSLDPADLVGCAARDQRDRTDNPKCVQCGHGMLDHRHYNSLWMKKEEVQTSVDESAKARFFKAKLDAEQQAKVQKQVQDAVDAMSARVADQTAEIGRLAEEYSQLSLSGNLAGQVQKAVRMVELHAEAMAGQSTDEQTTNRVQHALKTLKDKLDLLNKAKSTLGVVTRFCRSNIA